MLKNATSDTVNRKRKKRILSQEVATPCMDDHLTPLEDFERNGELLAVCAQIVLKCLCLARIGRQNLLWAGITLARSVTKQCSTCDKDC